MNTAHLEPALPVSIACLARSVLWVSTRRHGSAVVLWRRGLLLGSALALWRVARRVFEAPQ